MINGTPGNFCYKNGHKIRLLGIRIEKKAYYIFKLFPASGIGHPLVFQHLVEPTPPALNNHIEKHLFAREIVIYKTVGHTRPSRNISHTRIGITLVSKYLKSRIYNYFLLVIFSSCEVIKTY